MIRADQENIIFNFIYSIWEREYFFLICLDTYIAWHWIIDLTLKHWHSIIEHVLYLSCWLRLKNPIMRTVPTLLLLSPLSFSTIVCELLINMSAFVSNYREAEATRWCQAWSKQRQASWQARPWHHGRQKTQVIHCTGNLEKRYVECQNYVFSLFKLLLLIVNF